MTERGTTLLSGILCVLLFALTDRSSSPAQALGTPAEPQREADRRQEESFRRMEEQQREMIQRQQEHERRMEEQRLKDVEEQKAIRKSGDEYTTKRGRTRWVSRPNNGGRSNRNWRRFANSKRGGSRSLNLLGRRVRWLPGREHRADAGGNPQHGEGLRSVLATKGRARPPKAPSAPAPRENSRWRRGIPRYVWGGGIRSGQFSATTGNQHGPLRLRFLRRQYEDLQRGQNPGQSRVGGHSALCPNSWPGQETGRRYQLGLAVAAALAGQEPCRTKRVRESLRTTVECIRVDKPDPDQVRQQVERCVKFAGRGKRSCRRLGGSSTKWSRRNRRPS